MEDDLDRIAAGDEQRVEWLHRFYFGENDGDEGLHELVSDLGAIDAREINSIPIDGDSGIVLRVGRYGPYLERDEQRANVPEDLRPTSSRSRRREELLAQPSGDRELGVDPETGREIVARTGRYGPYVTEVLDGGLEGQAAHGVALQVDVARHGHARRRAAAALAAARARRRRDGEEVTARNGRYGPYVQKGKETRSLESEEQLFTITLEEALALLAQPQAAPRPRPGAAAAEGARRPTRRPASRSSSKEGRFGPYVTDGETNASLRQGDDPEALTLERAIELLADRRARGPAKKPARSAAKKPRSPASASLKEPTFARRSAS